MKKLKNISQYNLFIYFLLMLSILNFYIKTSAKTESIYNDKSNKVCGVVTDYKIKKDKIVLYLKSKENILVECKKNLNIKYGDHVFVKGKFKLPNNNTNFNLFNYKKYLLSKKIKYIVYADDIKIVNNSSSILYKIKNKINDRINKCKYSKKYLKTFLFADKSYIDEETYKNYQKMGISHLLAISGMHVSLITLLLLKLLSNLKENIKYTIISIILIVYLFLTNFTISMVRSCIQFILIFLKNILNLKIENYNLVLILFCILFIYNPYYIYDIGFIFSFLISFTIIKFNYLLNKNKLIRTSKLSFLVSIPILINNFYQVNLLSIIFNLICIPYVTYILFPSTLISFIFPIFDQVNHYFILIFERIIEILSKVNVLTISIAKLPIAIIILYYLLLYISLKKDKNTYLFLMLLIFLPFYKTHIIFSKIIFNNVGQGDSILIRIKNENIVIDTSGNINYDNLNNILIPYYRSEGVKKIDYLIITHGDYDHMGEAITLVNNFKVEKVIFNCGEYETLEKELIKVLDKKKIKYYSCIKELKIDNNKLYFLQTKEYDNENDNSNVIYTEISGYKFMFMGDAGIEKEKDILDKYNISDIDVLKVGHHGSKTSSSKTFIDEINPKYSIISVGKNNRYGHPNKEVLNNLDNSKIYRTDEDGSIMFKIKNNKLKIENCEG